MDSVTQLVLGGTVAYAVMGNKVGRRAALYGAVLGTLPDLDVLVNFGGEVENFTFHRSFSHSLLLQLLITPLLAWLITKFHPSDKAYFKPWCAAVYLSLATHALLDTCTTYGTQLLWPLSQQPFSSDNIFIIDPLYSLPLIVAFFASLTGKAHRRRARRFVHGGLILSSAYLLWSLAAKQRVDQRIQQALAVSGIGHTAYKSMPAPFTTLLWRAVAMEDNGYYEIYASVFDKPAQISLQKYPSEPALLQPIADDWRVQRLIWFTRGFYAVKRQGNQVLLSDIRMGLEGGYVFNFEVGQVVDNTVVAGSFALMRPRPEVREMALVYRRIWDANTALTPEARQRFLTPGE